MNHSTIYVLAQHNVRKVCRAETRKMYSTDTNRSYDIYLASLHVVRHSRFGQIIRKKCHYHFFRQSKNYKENPIIER